jgi:DNA-binding response OmpR family regulator
MQQMNVPFGQPAFVHATAEQAVAETVRIVFLQRDPLLAETYRAKLELDGYQVTVASPSDDAMENLRSTPPDIIFLDVSSGATDDRVVLHGLRDDPTTGRIPVVILSNRTAGELALDGMDLGPLDYLVQCA